MRDSDLRGYIDSFDEHWRKAVQALNDPEMCQTINGWVGDLQGFAEKIREECINALDHGGKINSRGDSEDLWDYDRVEDYFNKKMENVTALDRQNRTLAKKHNIPLR